MWRYPRIALVTLALIPLGIVAQRFCWLDFVDAAYHSLLWLHKHMATIFAVYGALLAAAALYRIARVHGSLASLAVLCSEAPREVRDAFDQAAARRALPSVTIIYVDVPTIFCFTITRRRVLLSRGFVDALDSAELELVAHHELLHVQRNDALRGLLWHLFFAALIVPGFESIERVLYRRRERFVDAHVRLVNRNSYDALLARFQQVGLCSTAPVAAFQGSARLSMGRLSAATTAVAPIVFVLLLTVSHLAFLTHAAYLQIHHC